MSTVVLLVVVLGGGLIVVLFAVCVFLFVMNSRLAAGRWTPLTPTGEPIRLHVIGPADTPLTSSAAWSGDDLVIRSEGAATIRLFEVPLDGVEQSIITYRFRIRTENLAKPVYPEMWCRIPGKGEFFSRGLHCKVRGMNDWTPVEIPFYLELGQRADHLRLNLVFQGAGTVELKDIEVLATPAGRP